MKKHLITIICLISSVSMFSYGQYISPFKYENGKTIQKSNTEILSEEASINAAKKRASYPTDFEKSKKKPRDNGEIWIDGYCRFRLPSYNSSRYNESITENQYCTTKYPADTIISIDSFKGNSSIPWSDNLFDQNELLKYYQFEKRLINSNNDGIPFTMYDSLTKISWYHVASQRGYKKGRDYEFSRAVSFWVKRKNGPEKMPLTFIASYAFSNGKDYTDFEFNDNGRFIVKRFCDNCESPMYKEVESGKSKSWKTGDWNEVTIKKDDFNTVFVFINQEELCHYQLSNLPIAARFAEFSLKMPYEWDKKKLMYNIGMVTSISYPKTTKN